MRIHFLYRFLLILAIACAVSMLTACAPQNVKPGDPPPAFTPAKFCAGAKDADLTIQTFAAIKPLSAKDARILADAEAILWPKNADGTPANAACNSNPMPATFDTTLALQLIGAAVQLAAVGSGN